MWASRAHQAARRVRYSPRTGQPDGEDQITLTVRKDMTFGGFRVPNLATAGHSNGDDFGSLLRFSPIL